MTLTADTLKLRLELPTEHDRRRFASLLEFARHGRVISGWQAPAESDSDCEWSEDVPVYDTTDLSGDPWYPLAYTLELCQWFSYVGIDDCLIISCTNRQPDLLAAALAEAPFPAATLAA